MNCKVYYLDSSSGGNNMSLNRSISNFSFFSMTASLFVTVYEYPTFAGYGKTAIFFLLFCGIFWFLPLSLCSAELSGIEGYQEGGIFSWVGNSMGEANGFAAIFFQWFQVTVGFVTMLYFIVGTSAYILKLPSINSDPLYKFLVVISLFWILTALQLKGTDVTTRIAKYGFSIGIIVPVIIMLVLTIFYFFNGHHISTNFTQYKFYPTTKDLPALSTFLLAYMGVEASAPHISDLQNSRKNYPKILVQLVLVGILTSAIGGSILSMVLPGKISANEGVMDAISRLFYSNHLLVFFFGFLIIFGITAQVSSWIVSPTEGLQYTAKRGILSEKLTAKNSAGVPVKLLVLQGLIVTLWAALLTFSSGSAGGSLSFQAAISLTVLIYLSAYVLLFCSYLLTAVKKDSLQRSFKVPGGKCMKLILGSLGLAISVLAIATTFLIPKSIPNSQGNIYILMLIISYVIVICIPYGIYFAIKRKSKA